MAYHDGFISGGAPEAETGFDTLVGMGVRTIISVDGAEPDVEGAAARGIRYVHLPIGYNGFDEARKLQLVRATRDGMRAGPVYIHCHHGKHRSAGAAATVAASLGWTTPAAAVERMRVSGTAPNYAGLYACAGAATVIDACVIDAVPANFPAVARPETFVTSMLELDQAIEHLKAIESAGWGVPSRHPDLVPAAEAGRVADLLRVLASGNHAQNKPADFTAMLGANSDRAQSLEDLLIAGERDAARLSAQFNLVAASCRDCHAKYRD
ncbi:MAG: cytochrome c [Phycisphaerae bacterium]|nr:cytochrome c [Phycisphaerae bacterium]